MCDVLSPWLIAHTLCPGPALIVVCRSAYWCIISLWWKYANDCSLIDEFVSQLLILLKFCDTGFPVIRYALQTSLSSQECSSLTMKSLSAKMIP